MRSVLIAALVLASCETKWVPVSDAGGCSVICGSTDVCVDGSCVPECVSDSACAHLANGICDSSTRSCKSGCASDSECADVLAPSCGVDHRCHPCAGDSACARFTATPVCDEPIGRCAACTPDTEGTRCAGNACLASGNCGQWARGSRDTCQACLGDAECGAGRKCIAQSFQGASVGSYCMLEQPASGCGDQDASLFPYSFPTETSSVDGAAATYCLLRPGITCEAKADLGIPCSIDDACGADGIADGVCRAITPRYCTYACLTAADCDPGVSCVGTPKVCQP